MIWHLAIEGLKLLGLYLEAQEQERLHPHAWIHDDATLKLYELDLTAPANRRRHRPRFERVLARLATGVDAPSLPEESARAFADFACLMAAECRRAHWVDLEQTACRLRLRACEASYGPWHEETAAAAMALAAGSRVVARTGSAGGQGSSLS